MTSFGRQMVGLWEYHSFCQQKSLKMWSLVRGCFWDTDTTYIQVEVHPGPLLWLLIHSCNTVPKLLIGVIPVYQLEIPFWVEDSQYYVIIFENSTWPIMLCSP